MPHPTTLMKLTTRCGSAAGDGSNEALLAKAAEAKVVRTSRIRVDTTVVPANVAYPADSGLLAKAVNRIRQVGRRIQAARGAIRTKVRNRSRAAGRRAHDLNAKLRTRHAAAKDEALAAVRRKNLELANLAETAAADAERLLANATRRITAHTRQRMAGTTPDGATRRSACMIPMPARSRKAGSASRSSSAPKPRCVTTPTGSFSTTTSRPATLLTHPRRGTGQEANRQSTTHRGRRPWLWRSQCR